MLILASASPRRADLLRAAGFQFVVHPVDIDEQLHGEEQPGDYVVRLAREKAEAAAGRQPPGALILAADTAVVVDGEILGKPSDEADARRMLQTLSGRSHEVLTGVALKRDRLVKALAATTVVSFCALTPAEIDWYVSSGEPRDKAGAYAVQGLASRFVEGIQGSYSNVVGLPVSLVYQLLKSFTDAPA